MPIYSSWVRALIALIPAVHAVALPVSGISLVALLLLDALIIRRVPALRRMLNTA